jgi:hypothetical protein
VSRAADELRRQTDRQLPRLVDGESDHALDARFPR